MYLSSDLTVINDIGSPDCVGVYNSFSHSFSVVHKEVYKYLQKCASDESFDNIYEDLSEEQIEVFLNNGILFKNLEQYYSLRRHAETPDRQRQIITIYLHLTLECNLSCEYCYNANLLVEQCPTLGLARWKEALDKLYAEGLKNIILTGGEPLLYPWLYDLVEHAKQLGLHVTLLTNGTLVTVNNEVFTLIDKCIVSLDSLSTSKRSGIENYDVLQNILEVAGRHPDKISVRSVIVRGLEEEAEELTVLLNNHKIEHIKILFAPSHVNEICHMPDYDKYKLYDDELSTTNRCGAGDTILAINHTGDIFPCQMMMMPEFCMGNIFDDDWKQLYDNNEINDIMAAICEKEHIKCEGCSARQFCNGGCRAAAYRVYGDIEHICEYCCDYQIKSARETIRRVFVG